MKELTLTGTSSDLTVLNIDAEFIDFSVNSQLFDKIFLPKKIKTVIARHIPTKSLLSIDSDKKIAIEKCYLVLSLFVSTIFDDNNPDGWKNLSSTILHDITKKNNSNDFIYKKILDVLKKGTENGPIIEVYTNSAKIEEYCADGYSKKYRLVEKYRSIKSTDEYQLTTDYIIARRKNAYNKSLLTSLENPIAKNCIYIQAQVEFPTHEELLLIGKELVKSGHKTNKGKKLTLRNKHSNEYWNDADNRSFVEDDIELYKLLTKHGYWTPIIGGDNSGGRIVDSFTLMPSWIRKQATINGLPIVEKDYSALHPNICANIYGDTTGIQITHDMVAKNLGLDRQEVKIEHLAFFNKRIEGMEKSILYPYYTENHLEMLNNILQDKSKFYKLSTMKMFKMEVELMTRVITQLNSQGIYVIYVYDALYASNDLAEYVGEVMNKEAAKMNINTTTKIEVITEHFEEQPIQSITEEVKVSEIEEEPSDKQLLDYLFNHPNKDELIGGTKQIRKDIDYGKITTYQEIDELLK